MRSTWILASALALMTTAGGTTAQAAPFDAVFAGFGAETPGCAVGVQVRSQPDTFAGYGMADLEHGAAITPQTVFEAGSVSKQFTAASILLLVADGKIALGDDIRTYLPEMPVYGRPITVDMLLSHTSGLRDWGEVMELAGWPRTSRVYTAAEVLQIASRQTALNYTPGDAYSYTNTGYNLAGLIVQRVSGQTLAEFTRDRLFRPLGMTHTGWRDNFRRVVKDRAIAYAPGGAGAWLQDMPFENTYGHGALLTTVGDLLIWNDALTTGALGAKLDDQMRQQPTVAGGRRIAYARGLVVQMRNGMTEVAHAGATAGYRAWLGRYPKEGVSVALLCNRGDVNPVALGRSVVDAVLPPPAKPPAATPKSAPTADELARLPGLYVDETAGAVLRVAAENGALRLRGGPVLTPIGPGRYRGPEAEFAFGTESVTRRTSDGETVSYRRIAPGGGATELEPLAGTWASAEAGAALVAIVRDGKLVLSPGDRPSAALAATPLEKDLFLAGDNLVRVVRGPDGRAVALRFTRSRVYALDFRRAGAP